MGSRSRLARHEHGRRLLRKWYDCSAGCWHAKAVAHSSWGAASWELCRSFRRLAPQGWRSARSDNGDAGLCSGQHRPMAGVLDEASGVSPSAITTLWTKVGFPTRRTELKSVSRLYHPSEQILPLTKTMTDSAKSKNSVSFWKAIIL